jgi:hypothetical protein
MPPKKNATKTNAGATPDIATGSSATGPSSDGAAEFEKLGVFYLGRPYDLAAKKTEAGMALV